VYNATGTIWLEPGMYLSLQIETIYNSQMLGASGAVFGVLTAFGIMYPEARIMLLFPPIPLKAKVFIPILILMELSLGIGNWDNVAHFAHLGGALFGYILLKIWNKNNNFFI
jgi:rhomboid-like protein